MRYLAQIARVSLQRKNLVRDVGGKIEQAAVGVVNENKGRLALFY
jgi:hypothetical protein